MQKIITYPLFLIISLLIYFGLIELDIPLSLVPSITFFITVIYIIGLEKLNPYRPDWNIDQGDFWTDLIQTLIVLPIVAKSLELLHRSVLAKFQIHIWPDSWPFVVQVIVITLFADFLFYWYHRIAHTNKFLIKYHAVHHGANRVCWANAGRFHVVDLIGQFSLYFIPVYFLITAAHFSFSAGQARCLPDFSSNFLITSFSLSTVSRSA